MAGLYNNSNTFALQSGNVPASELDTNFSELAIMSQYASTVAGTANDIALTVPLNLSAGLQLGVRVAFIAAASNTDVMTASVNGSANPSITKRGLVLAPGDVRAGGFYEIYYNGSNWVLDNPTATEYLVAVNALTAAATSDFTSVLQQAILAGAYKKYRVDMVDLRVSSSPVNITVQVSQDGGATWRSGASDYQWANRRNTALPGGADEGSSADASMQIIVSASNSTTSGVVRAIDGTLEMFNPGGSFLKTFRWTTNYLNNVAVYNHIDGGGTYTGATSGSASSSVTGLRFAPSAGTLTGNMYLYGIR